MSKTERSRKLCIAVMDAMRLQSLSDEHLGGVYDVVSRYKFDFSRDTDAEVDSALWWWAVDRVKEYKREGVEA